MTMHQDNHIHMHVSNRTAHHIVLYAVLHNRIYSASEILPYNILFTVPDKGKIMWLKYFGKFMVLAIAANILAMTYNYTYILQYTNND